MSVTILNLLPHETMVNHSPAYPHPHRKYWRKNANTGKMNFKAQIFSVFTILIVITMFVLIVSLMTTKHSRSSATRTRAKQQLHQRTLHKKKRSSDISEEDEIRVVPFSPSESVNNAIPLDIQQIGESFETLQELSIPEDYDYTCVHNKYDGATDYVSLFTFIPTTISKLDLKYALNTVKMWSLLDKRIQAVIYVPSNMNETHLEKISRDMCSHGVDVKLVDKVVMKSHTTMRTLFELSYSAYKAVWYGYAEYGTLFDSSLLSALNMLASCPNVTRKGNLVLGQSHSLELRDWDPSITSELDIDTVLEHINTFTVIDEKFLGNGVHYYFTMRYGFPWDKIPALIPGSSYLDSFLMWYTMKNTSIAGVDATDAIFTLHQNDLNITDPSTYSKHVKVYNEVTITKAKYPLYYKKGLGVIRCLEYFLDNTNSPYHILSKRQRKYIRRIVKSKPASLSYYCKVARTDKVALIEQDGVIYNRLLA